MSGKITVDEVAVAQARAIAARAQLAETIKVIRHRTNPQVIASDVATSIKVRGNHAVQTVVESARQRPWEAGISAALVGLFLVRGPIYRTLFGRKKSDKIKR